MSSNLNPNRAKVRRTLLPRWSLPPVLVTLESVCRAGARCSTVQGSPSCKQAHLDLEGGIESANKTLSNKRALAGMFAQASAIAVASSGEMVVALRLYETSVACVARGDAKIMRAAGFEPRRRPNAPPGAPAVLRRTRLSKKRLPDVLATVEAIFAAGAACPAIQGSAAAKAARARLWGALAVAKQALARKASLAAELAHETRGLEIDCAVAVGALRAYEDAVGRKARGDAAVINEAGLASSEDQPPTRVHPRKVTGLRGKPAGRAREAMLSWDGARGATGYAVQLKLAPEDEASPWVALEIGDGHAYRLVTVPVPRARFLARVAAVGHDGATAEWSDPIVVVAS